LFSPPAQSVYWITTLRKLPQDKHLTLSLLGKAGSPYYQALENKGSSNTLTHTIINNNILLVINENLCEHQCLHLDSFLKYEELITERFVSLNLGFAVLSLSQFPNVVVLHDPNI